MPEGPAALHEFIVFAMPKVIGIVEFLEQMFRVPLKLNVGKLSIVFSPRILLCLFTGFLYATLTLYFLIWLAFYFLIRRLMVNALIYHLVYSLAFMEDHMSDNALDHII